MPGTKDRRDALAAAVRGSILQEHLEELDFLWEQRERVLFAADWTLRALGELEERAEAHLDGLRIGGEEAIDFARPALSGEESGAATAAAFAFLAARTSVHANELMDALSPAKDEVRDGIRIALRHGEIQLVTDRLYELSVGADRRLRALAADVLAFHRLRPPPELDHLLSDDDPVVRRLAYVASGRFGKTLSERYLHDALVGDDPTLRRLALEAAARCGLPEVAACCRRLSSRVPEALAFLGIVGSEEDIPTLRAALGSPSFAKGALAALGSLGSVGGMPLILRAMENPELAVAAETAFQQLAGTHDLSAPRPSTHAPEVDESEDAVIDEAALPDPSRARAQWEHLQPRFAPAGRWQAGTDIAKLSIEEALRVLPLRSRRDVYLGARARDIKATPDIELERRVRVQHAVPPPTRR